MKTYEGNLNASGKAFALVASRFNNFITQQLISGAEDCLLRHGADADKIDLYRVPGSFEIPLMAQKCAASKKYDAVICLGAVIRGETPHFEYIASQAARGTAGVSLSTGVPVIFGIITSDTIEQAIDRAGVKAGNKGADAAASAIEMADLLGRV